jgi:deazaflavin-dependent oxidoreductase (nitroreductase family)
MTLAVELAALDFCYVTTTGRTTGKPHRIEIWFAAHPERDTIFMMSGGRERSDWVRNLVASPTCSVEIGGETFRGYARVIEGTSEDEQARTRVHDKYATGNDLESWRATALPLAIDLTPNPNK